MLPRLPHFLALCLLPLLAVSQGHADINRPEPKDAGGAPAVTARKVEAIRGQPIDIEISGTHRSGSLSFIIRNQPKLGKLEGPPVSKTKLSAVVRYIPTPGLKGNKDEFTFAAQVPGSSTSEPATVSITISDAAPKLDTLPLVDAGRVVMGLPSSRVFNIKNAGNAPWKATVPAPAGWKWITPAGGAFSIAQGEDVRCEIACEALAVGNLDQTVPLTGEAKIQFTARVVPPFTLLPRQLTLTWNPETKTRSGSVEVQNMGNQPLTIAAAAPEWAKVAASAEVAADASGKLAVTVEGEYAKEFAGAVKISAGNYSQNVEVKAAAAPAMLLLRAGARSDGGVHFGQLDAEAVKTAKMVLTFKNVGGSEAPLTVSELRDFRIESPPAPGSNLAPGAETSLTILPPARAAGTFRENLVLRAGDSKFEVLLTAGVDSSAIPLSPTEADLLKIFPPKSAGARVPRRDSEIKRTALGNSRGFYQADGSEDPKLPRIDVVDLDADTGNSVTFSWDLPEGEGWKFQLYRAGVQRVKSSRNPELGEFVKVWLPCGDEVKYSVAGRRASATVSDLNPGVWFKCCLQTIAPDGRRSFPGKELGFYPRLQPPPAWRLNWQYYTAGAVILLALGYWIRKKWRAPITAGVS